MIFVTVGSDTPFDRLIRTVDQWARDNDRRDVFAQIGMDAWQPEFIPYSAMLSPAEFRKQLESAHVVVAHAGMGTIIAALEFGKPLLMLPRLGRLRESRNDNQVGSARHFRSFRLFEVVETAPEIPERIDHMLANLQHYRSATDAFAVGDSLIDAIREFANA